MKKFARLLLAAIVAASSLVFTDGPRADTNKMNVIILSVDTLRADRLGCFGYRHNTSPNIDKLAAQGTMFTDAMTNVPLTNPSFASMFTSRYPHEIGSIRNGIPMVDGFTTLAALYRENGYHTAAVLSNWPLKARLSNLHQGFEIYEDNFKEKRWLFFNSERDAEGVSDLALMWLEKKPKEPFFAWIHYSDPHSPYIRHDDFAFDKTDSDSANYDSEVAYTDHHLGRVIDQLRNAGYLERSLVVFLSDHGESLGEHNYVGHGRKVYQPSMRVPFILVGPGIAKNKKDPAIIQLLDLAPTLLSYSGLKPASGMRGLDLMPYLRGETSMPERVIYYETYPGAAPQMEGADKMLTSPIYVGTREKNIKVMYNVRYQKWESYNLAKDPLELSGDVDLRDQDFIKRSNLLMSWYKGWIDRMVVGEIDVMTDEDFKQFESLGYIDGP